MISVLERLQAFPYYQNYIDLTRLELAALYAITSSSSASIRKIAFIGSGPLPLSSLCLRDALNSKDSPFGVPPAPMTSSLDLDTDLNAVVVGKCEPEYVTLMNIDRDDEALDLSRRLCQALGTRGTGMEFLCADLGAVAKHKHKLEIDEMTKSEHGLQDYDAVFLAALVGEGQEEKEDMIEKVAGQMKEGSILVVRSADGMRALLYPVSPIGECCEI